MRQWFLMGGAFAAAILTGCGRSNHGQSSAPSFSRLVSFGDSLSDVGTYRLGDVKAAGGGKYTINSASGPTPQIWTELLGIEFGLPAVCPAQTGLDGTGNNQLMPPTNNDSCFSYAQGGSRVTNPIGIGNKNSPATTAGVAAIGPLTVPVATQIQNHLTKVGGSFTGTEVVFVWAGGNDFFTWFGAVGEAAKTAAAQAVAKGGDAAAAAAAGAAAAAAELPTAVAEISKAGSELAGYVQDQIVAKGARYVVVLGVPDVNSSPFGTTYQDSKDVIAVLVNAFNTKLQAGLTSPNVLYLDLVQTTAKEISHPTDYGILDASKTACGSTSGLLCTEATTTPIAPDSSHFFYADSVHPTPYGHALVANFVHQQMYARGWAQNWLMLFPARFQDGTYLPF